MAAHKQMFWCADGCFQIPIQGFTDKLYRERRMKLTTYALNYNQ